MILMLTAYPGQPERRSPAAVGGANLDRHAVTDIYIQEAMGLKGTAEKKKLYLDTVKNLPRGIQ